MSKAVEHFTHFNQLFEIRDLNDNTFLRQYLG